jgi:hypothetical protein
MPTKEREDINEIAEIVREMETNYIRGNTVISKYVNHNMYETISTIEAYLNSVHTSGQFDSQGREKPFFNIVVAAANIWYRATDIDRKNIRIKATKSKDTIDAMLANIHVQNWMTRENFGQFLNEWGRVLSRYGSAVVEFIEKDGRLIPSVLPWNRLIVDSVSFYDNPRIKILELTEAQLKKNPLYDKDMVEALCDAQRPRETIDKRRKDNISNYIKVYEVRGEFELSYITNKEKDDEIYQEQLHVISFVQNPKKKNEYLDFTLYKGRVQKNPQMITHLIEEDGRTLSIGAVEHLFQSQWMVNHSALSIKNQLDLASKLIFQTSDGTFLNQNALSAIENGDILIHAVNQPLTQLQNNSHDITSLLNFQSQWKSLGNEITGVSESMLGIAPKSGTPWRQTESLLQESYSLFELMTENKGMYIENMFREFIIPFIKKNLNHKEEISATLESYDIDKIDSIYLKNASIAKSNDMLFNDILNGKTPTNADQQSLIQNIQSSEKEALNQSGQQRFISPSKIKNQTWKEQFKDMEWDLEVDITGEAKDYQAILATLNTALQTIMNPAYQNSPEAKMVVNEILRNSGYLSPIQLQQIKPSPIQPQPTQTPAPVTTTPMPQ